MLEFNAGCCAEMGCGVAGLGMIESRTDTYSATPQPISAQQPALNSNTPQTSISKVSSTSGVSPGLNHASPWCNKLHTHYKCLPSYMRLQLSRLEG